MDIQNNTTEGPNNFLLNQLLTLGYGVFYEHNI